MIEKQQSNLLTNVLNLNRHAIILLMEAKKCFHIEYDRVVKQIECIKRLQHSEDSNIEYEKINYMNQILSLPLTNEEMEHRRLIIDFCNETYHHYVNKKRNLKIFIKECDKVIKTLTTSNNNLTIDKYISIESHLRVALASVDIYFPDERFSRVRTGINCVK